nr:SLBB domain-containing protein [uncultured Sphingomonas sp.]
MYTLNRSTVVVVALASSALAWVSPVQAQSSNPYGANPYGSNTPSGSPLDPTGMGSQGSASVIIGNVPSSSQMPAATNTATTSSILSPQVISDRSAFLTREDLIRAQQGNTTNLYKKPAAPGEFEEYMARLLGRPLPRFGADLLLPSQRDFATPAMATVPPSYIINPGDRISISLSGSIDGSVVREVDTNGNIFLANVGSIHVAGVRYGDLKDKISAAVGRQYRGYEVSVSISELRGIRVYVTGFANNPGAFSVNSLSTMANAVFQAGGPSSGGSFRTIKLYRNGQEVGDFDMYELLRGGNRINDMTLQNEDVLFIPPAGEQVAVIGSVNEEAIYEAKPGESMETMLAAAGGPTALGDSSRLILYRTNTPDITGPQQIRRAEAAAVQVISGDIMQVLPKGSLAQPTDRQSILVRIDGEVNRPGIYYVPPNTPTSQVVQLAGGLTRNAYVYGTKFVRQSVMLQQQDSYKEAIRQLEMTLASAPLTSDTSQSAELRNSQLQAANAFLDRLKKDKPDGRVVLDILPSATAIPDGIRLENNDSIHIPTMATTVGVFGAVYRPASFLVDPYRPLKVKDYVYKAGGPVRAADKQTIFVVRANGEVLPKSRGAMNTRVLPGDIIFVPVKTQTGVFWSRFKDITTSLLSLGLSAGTIAAVVK